MRTFLLSLLAVVVALPALAADEHYTVASAPLALKVGANGNLVVTIKPAPGLHFNKEYPAKFSLTANPNVKAAKEKFSAKDGDVKTTGNDGQLTVALTGVKAGETTVTFTGSFSVCSDEQCYMKQNQVVTAKVAVK
jgi:hypothetical protein